MSYPRLMGAIADLYAQSDLPILQRAAHHLSGFDFAEPAVAHGRRKPVCRFVHGAVAAAAMRELADAFAAIEPESDWVQNPNYTTATIGDEFLDRYGYVELVGPGRPFESRAFLVGFLLLGPGAHYPRHAHAAEEVYHVVSGRAQWWREDRDWHAEPPGAAIHHAPNVAHAMRCADEPLLALYCWAGNIAPYARLSDGAASA